MALRILLAFAALLLPAASAAAEGAEPEVGCDTAELKAVYETEN